MEDVCCDFINFFFFFYWLYMIHLGHKEGVNEKLDPEIEGR